MLALELHARHGWQMRGLAPPADKYSMNPWRGLNNIPDHVYCLREDGLPVDVNGVFASEAAIHRFYAHQHNPDEQLLSIDLSLEDFESYLYEHGYRRPYDVEQEFIERHVQNLALDQLP
jgi:hypothetical protein